MGQDIKDLLHKERLHTRTTLSDNHEARFLARLEAELPQKETTEKKRSFSWYYMAASVALFLIIASVLYQQFDTDHSAVEIVKTDSGNDSDKLLSLGDISPDLKKIEDYYTASINYELTQVEVSEDGKQLFQSYMKKLSLLNDEHKMLQQELNTIGPNEQTIQAMIDNLQFRLKLLYQLKEKLNELKTSNHEI